MVESCVFVSKVFLLIFRGRPGVVYGVMLESFCFVFLSTFSCASRVQICVSSARVGIMPCPGCISQLCSLLTSVSRSIAAFRSRLAPRNADLVACMLGFGVKVEVKPRFFCSLACACFLILSAFAVVVTMLPDM